VADDLHHWIVTMTSPTRNVRRAQDDRGSVLPLVGIGLILMLIMAAFAIDLGTARQAKGLAQSTTDSASLAGAEALAGVTNGTTPPTGMSRAVWDAGQWAFKNLSLSAPTNGTKPCDGNASKTCFTSSTNNTKVEVTTPYTTTKVAPDGSAYNPDDLVHVKTCYDEATYMSAVIGISSIRVCAESTAHVIGQIDQNNDTEDETNDPFALCTTSAALFDTSKWFPGSKATKDIPKEIPGKQEFGGTYQYSSDLDQSSVKIVIGSANAFVIAGQASAKTHTISAPSPYITITSKAPPAGMFKYEIKFKNYTTVDGSGNPNGAKNFKDYLPDGIYAFSIYAAAVNGSCNQTTFSVTIGSPSAPAQSGECQEDLFRGGTSPASGTVMTASNRTITATFYDETRPFVAADDVTSTAVLDHEIHLWGKGGTLRNDTAYGQDLTASIVYIPASSDEDTPIVGHGQANPGGSHEYQWKQSYTYTIPDTYINGEYTFTMRVYDSDQNKAGGDCGYAYWTVNFQGGQGGVELIE
jgi:hypothetical protein